MHPRYLTAFEHQILPVGDNGSGPALTSDEAAYLAALGTRRPGFCERGHRTVRLAQYCGIVNLGGRILEILPKIDDAGPPDECRGMLLRMLHEATEYPLFQHLSVGQHLRRAPLLDIFIAAFFDSVTEIVRGGLLRQYQGHEEELLVVRGRIVTSRQCAVHANRPDRIACRFDELTGDNIWNQLIKAGLRAVRPWIANGELHRRWVELMTVFEEVRDTPIDAGVLRRLVLDRRATRYQTAIGWVRWILALLSPALRAGEHPAPGLLFDMNLLFQSAVTAVLRRRAEGRSGVQIHSQETGRYLAAVVGAGGRRAFGLQPDIVVRRRGAVVAIGDTKWKRLDAWPSGYLKPTRADLYQMQAYAAGFACEELALIYPWHRGLTGSKETAFELPAMGALRPVVSVVGVDLQQESFSIVCGQASSIFGRLLAGNSTSVSRPRDEVPNV